MLQPLNLSNVLTTVHVVNNVYLSCMHDSAKENNLYNHLFLYKLYITATFVHPLVYIKLIIIMVRGQ